MITLGLVANVFNECNALPGWLEMHTPYFDDVRILHAGPGGSYSDDGTLEILEKWRIPVEFCEIDDGFGVVRTKALRMSPCDYVMLLDADERFYPIHQLMTCHGQGTPPQEVDWILQSYDYRGVNLPNWENIARLGENLTVQHSMLYNQGTELRNILSTGNFDAVATVRRHWHDLSFKRPTQNWNEHPDWQLRLVKNDQSIMFDPSTRMHERLVGAERVYHAGLVAGPFYEHFHFTFKRMEPDQRRQDVETYDRIHKGDR